ncbi:glycosyl hydrolases family 31-domain-containing protein [Mariannaea sp. PMI_226]|nr:glycosyl hydrolases family 31-domain-containing protein [Mariannaea sp. PMI_226]
MPDYPFATNPVADQDAIVSGPNYRFTLINNNVLRFEWAEDNIFEDRASIFAINRRFSERPKPLIRDTEHGLEIVTPTLHLSYDKKRFSPNGLVADLKGSTTLWGAQWRYGQKPERNLGGTARTLDEIDGRCDVGSGVISRNGFATIDDSTSMLFDGKGFVTTRREGDRVDGYLFYYGLDYRAGMKAFFELSGHTPRLPRWSLGNWWSRYHKYTAEEYLNLMDKFREQGIPLSVAVVDMDWHLVHEKEVPHAGWTGYTWNRKFFPDPEGFAASLHERNLKMTLNDHPHSGVACHEEQYEEMAKFLGHDTSVEKTTILFDPTNPRFVDAFFNILHRSLEKKGCDFWWMDWQQGPYSKIPGLDPLWLLNHYQWLDQIRQVGENNAMVFSRYAGPGSHRYPIGFSGDTVISWDSLRFQPEFTATASNIGYGWWSHDIGGHYGGYRDDELFARWAQLGVLSPIMRLHSTDNMWGSKEPWEYRPQSEQVVRYFMQLRHRLIPYLYTLNVRFAQHDEPLVEPLYWRYPARKEAYQYLNEYFFGPSLVVAPIVDPVSPKTLHAVVKAWLPPTAARHVDIFTGTVYDSNREVEMWRTLENVPTLAPEGAIIPLDAASEPANGGGNPEAFELLVVIGQDGKFDIIEDVTDDAESNKGIRSVDRITHVEWNQASGRLTIDKPTRRAWSVRFLSVLDQDQIQNVSVKAGDASVENVQIGIETSGKLSPGLVVKLPTSSHDGPITIQMKENPQLSVVDLSDKFRKLILDFQMDFALKHDLYAILQEEKPAVVKVGELLNLPCDKSLVGPFVELLIADSR